MKDATFLAMFIGVGVLMIGLAIPLIRGRVAPNLLYGLRIRATLEDEAIWYPANRHAGRGLVGCGVTVIVGSLALYLVPWPEGMGTAFYVLALTALLLISTVTTCARSIAYAHRLAALRREKRPGDAPGD